MRSPDSIARELKAFWDTFENKSLSPKNRKFVKDRIIKLTDELLDARAKEIEDASDVEDDDVLEFAKEPVEKSQPLERPLKRERM